jgi:3-oxoacyl-[acyl-carrier protein] reductase
MFVDNVVIITGSTTGIGKATAKKFAQQGANVVINSLSSVENGNAFVHEINKLGGNAIYIQGDMSLSKDVENLFSRVVDRFGKVDILVNNAGHTEGMDFLSSDKDHWIKLINANLMTAVLCAKEAVKVMQKQGSGKIINNASIRGFDYCGGENLMAYSASKAALISFTKTLAKHLAPNICVNAISPGFVSTPRFTAYPSDLKKAFLSATALKKFITPEEVADTIVFMASSSAMTGQVVTLDGGFTLKFA